MVAGHLGHWARRGQGRTMNSSVINSTTFAHDQRSNVAATVNIIADDPLSWQVKLRSSVRTTRSKPTR